MNVQPANPLAQVQERPPWESVRPVSLFAGRHVVLRPVEASDYGFLRSLETEPTAAIWYRHRGASIAPEQFATSLWAGVLNQFVVLARSDGKPLGVVVAYAADFRNQHARLASVLAPASRHTVFAADAIMTLVRYLFTVYPLRKLYMDVLSPNLVQFGTLTNFFQQEGHFREREYYAGQYVDLHVLTCSRESLDAVFDRMNGAAASGTGLSRAELLASLSDVSGVALPVDSASAQTPLLDVGFDSLSWWLTATWIEEATGTTLPDDYVAQLRTVEDLWHAYTVAAANNTADGASGP